MKELLDLRERLSRGDYVWEQTEDPIVRVLRRVIFCENPVTNRYQSMNIYAPKDYVNPDGTINFSARVNGHTPSDAPVIFRNNCSGWMSSDPDMDVGAFTVRDVAATGWVYVVCGARSRDLGRLGKMPAPVIDLKAGIRYLRRNADILPGCMDRIISVGGSGAGEMSSVLGATGNSPDYLPWLREIGAAGVEKQEDGTYRSTIRDDVYGCMCFYPITDLENADLAYAWSRFDSGETRVTLGGGGQTGTAVFTDFKLALQQDMARRFARYVNDLKLHTPEGKPLGFEETDGETDPRKGSFYEQILENISCALNAYLKRENRTEGWLAERYGDGEKRLPAWLIREGEGYHVTDLAGFYRGTGLARNKDIPGFDTFWKTMEGNGFGGERQTAAHFSPLTAELLRDHYDRYKGLPGFEACDADDYIREPGNETIRTQTRLMNSAHLLLANAREEKRSDPAPFWRIRSGTADEHTSFSVGYILALAAMENPGVQVDYGLVWDMRHGGEREGCSTGTFREWVESIL